MALLRHVLRQQTPIDDAPFHLGLKHREDVAVDLRFVGDERTGRVQDSRIDLPSGAGLQSERPGEEKNAVIACRPLLQASPHVASGRARLESHERVRKVVFELVVLRRKIVRLGFTTSADPPGVLVALVHVMRNRPHVVEELAEQVPSALPLHHGRSDEQVARGLHRVLQQKTRAVAGPHVTEPLVGRRPRAVVRVRCGREPPLVDAAAMPSERIQVVGVQFEAAPRQHERARHP